jgi:chromosome segregation protein
VRLTHIKLTGFKSFVDPTVIPITGQRVGIVGPNGCGKSNVIDAVRWVLGESRARELRGDSMQDVIFNGSASRKPVSRSSVELLFDNSRGRAGGQWSQYAEIAVKRVLTRDGTSAYYINNVHVRRRDVADVFLGTGLGGHGYAIIEQGMISAIVEARPEELRAYLEEAAGVSKYKERRRETELRLRDTNDNLARISDIQGELAARIEKLEGQAAVARQYFELKSELDRARRLYWLARKQEAEVQREKLNRDIAGQQSALEALNARFAELEKETETARQKHYAFSDAVNSAQGKYYGANSEVGRLEGELTHLRNTRRRIEAELEALSQKRAMLDAEQKNLMEAGQHFEKEGAELEQKRTEIAETLHSARSALPEKESGWRESQKNTSDLQRELTQSEHGIQVEEAHLGHALRVLEQLSTRKARLEEELERLPEPEPERLAARKAELEAAHAKLKLMETEHGELMVVVSQLEVEQRESVMLVEARSAALHRLQAEAAALEKLQEQAGHGQSLMREWFSRAGWQDCAQLWQAMEVETGWENAVEAALGHRVKAVLLNSDAKWARADLRSPPETVTLRLPDSVVYPQPSGETGLRSKVKANNPEAEALLDDWLSQYRVAESDVEAEQRRHELSPGALFITREGNVYSRSSLTLSGTQDIEHGLLLRRKELEQMLKEADGLQLALEAGRTRLQEVENRVRVQRDRIATLHEEIRQIHSAIGQLQIETTRLSEQAQRTHSRHEQINSDLSELEIQMERESKDRLEAETAIVSGKRERNALSAFLDDAQAECDKTELAYQESREALLVMDRDHREASFRIDTLKQRQEDLNGRVQRLESQAAELEQSDAQLKTELGNLDEKVLLSELRAALETRKLAEVDLVELRNALEAATTEISRLEQERMRVSHQLQPQRDKLEQLNLKRRELEMMGKQCDEQLDELPKSDSSEQINKLSKSIEYKEIISNKESVIETLGAVNLAALEELKSAQERKHYLDDQAEDLRQAANTMFEAIGRIDREMRARLKDTYENVNRTFSQFFMDIFGGGQASLVLTGEELLDAGLVVIAQPPGKKNTSIHLLSGGEKALAALALIFAMFSLNPAPFCLLDEVDAPLDDTNAERLSRLIEKMSGDIQFVFITHNKITMETAQQLIGITMQDAGVSRTVAVDVDEAAAMAA